MPSLCGVTWRSFILDGTNPWGTVHSQSHFPWRPTCSLEPHPQLCHLHAVEGGFAELDPQRNCIERRLPIPLSAAELPRRDCARLVQALGCDLGDVLHTLTVAKADEAFAR
jgi:hypothetical protein